MAGVGYIDFSKVIRYTETVELSKKLDKIEGILSEYQTRFSSIPTDNNVLGKYIKDGFRIGNQDLSDVSVFEDNISLDTTFNMLSSANGYPIEVCFGSETMSKSQLEMIRDVKEKLIRKGFPETKMTISGSCGDTEELLPVTFPEKVWVTYRIN